MLLYLNVKHMKANRDYFVTEMDVIVFDAIFLCYNIVLTKPEVRKYNVLTYAINNLTLSKISMPA